MEQPKEVTVTVRIEASLRDELREIAVEQGRDFSKEVRRALRIHAMNYRLAKDAA